MNKKKIIKICKEFDVHDITFQLDESKDNVLKVIFGKEFYTDLGGIMVSQYNDAYLVSKDEIKCIVENKLFNNEWINEFLIKLQPHV